MIKIHKDIHGVSLVTAWFANEKLKENGIIDYMESKTPIGRATEFFTLISDLTEDEEAIKNHFAKNCKYKINRAYRENITFQIVDSKDIQEKDIEEFIDFFDSFWKTKDRELEGKDVLYRELLEYKQNGNLTLAFACVQGEKAVYHIHINDESVARLLHSASLYRLLSDTEGTTRNIIGMANRALHFEEMKFFKAKGLTTYDWGGAGKTEDVASITEFKESFGGTPVTYYNGRQINGIKAKAICLAADIKGRLS